MGKRFKWPKKSKNSDLPRQPSASVVTFKFAYVYFVSPSTGFSTVTSYVIGDIKSWQTIESTALSTVNYGSHSYQMNSLASFSNYIWGYSFARMNIQADFNLMKPAVLSGSMTTNSISLATICLMHDTTFGGTNDADRIKYISK